VNEQDCGTCWACGRGRLVFVRNGAICGTERCGPTAVFRCDDCAVFVEECACGCSNDYWTGADRVPAGTER